MDINVFYFLRVIMAGHQKRKEILTYPPLGIREPQAWSEEFWKKKKKTLKKGTQNLGDSFSPNSGNPYQVQIFFAVLLPLALSKIK